MVAQPVTTESVIAQATYDAHKDQGKNFVFTCNISHDKGLTDWRESMRMNHLAATSNVADEHQKENRVENDCSGWGL